MIPPVSTESRLRDFRMLCGIPRRVCRYPYTGAGPARPGCADWLVGRRVPGKGRRDQCHHMAVHCDDERRHDRGANFAGQFTVETGNIIAHINVNGKDVADVAADGRATAVAPYGAAVEVLANQSASFNGLACNPGDDPGAVITANTCSFTMYVGADADGTGVTVIPAQ